MKKIILFGISILLSMGMVNYAFAFDFMLHDFATSPFDFNNNWSPIEYPHGVGYRPSPGLLAEGGEKFDLEGLFVYATKDNIYVALTSSFGEEPVWSTGWGQNYLAGDLFFDFDGGDYDFAIDITDHTLWHVTDTYGIPNKPGTYYNYSSIRNQVGAWTIKDGTPLGGITHKLTYWANEETGYLTPGNGNTWVWEWSIPTSLFSSYHTMTYSDNIRFHNTMECGNDLIEKSATVVPEPNTLILLGCGLLGAAGLNRLKKKKE